MQLPSVWVFDLIPLILYHHERIDGRGYMGLPGDRIPFEAKIVSIVDVFDAMFFSRPYQSARSLREFREEFERNSGLQFDAEVVTLMISLTGKMAVRMGAGNGDVPGTW